MTERFHDLSFEQTPDGVRLTQTDCGEEYVVLAHIEQLRYIVRRLGGMSETTATTIADLERRLSILVDRLEELVTAKWFRHAITTECSGGIEIMCRLDGLLDLAAEFDGGRLLPKRTTAPEDPPENARPPMPEDNPQPGQLF